MTSFLRTLAAVVTAFAAPSQTFSAPPNFLLILSDDHGYGDLSTYRKSDVNTPNLDRLAAGGMLFTGIRANFPVCSPSRPALLHGPQPERADPRG